VENSSTGPIFRHEFTVTQADLDLNGHVNNVNYVQWMQDAAIRHYSFIGGIAPMQAVGGNWVIRSHTVEYLRPAFAGDVIEVQTWVANIRRVRSLRRYRFLRKSDGKLLVKGETDWVFVDAATGSPLAIPDSVARLFTLLPDESNS
jgi:acyl-CoA thioester hydrolase